MMTQPRETTAVSIRQLQQTSKTVENQAQNENDDGPYHRQ